MRDNALNQGDVAYGTPNIKETHTAVPKDNKQFPGDKMPQNPHIVSSRKKPRPHRHTIHRYLEHR